MYDEDRPSKTQLKREATELQKLGERLVDLPGSQLNRLDLNADLQHAVEEARRTRSHGARRRQMQHIGKLMRDVDVEPIHSFFHDLDHGQKKDARAFQRLELLRDKLIAGDNDLIEQLVTENAADRQHLRQLIRNAQREQTADTPKGAAKVLFRYLRTLHEG